VKIAVLSLFFLASQSGVWGDLADDLIALKSMGMDDESLRVSVQQSNSKLSPGDMLKLKKGGFDNALIKKLLMAGMKPAQDSQAQPQTVVIQQQVAPAAQVEITVHTHGKGGKLHVDGKLVATMHGGINKVMVPSGEHEFRLDHADKEYRQMVNIDPAQPNVFYIFYFDEVNEHSKAVFERYRREFKRELAQFCEHEFDSDIVDRDGFTVGREYYKEIECRPYATIRTFGQEKTRLMFEGRFHKKIHGTKYNKEHTYKKGLKTRFFTLDIEDSLEVSGELVYFDRAKMTFDELVLSFQRLDKNLKTIEIFNAENHAPNVKIVLSEKALKDTRSFHLSIPLSDKLYDFQLQAGELAVCPLSTSYRYHWGRKGIEPSESFRVREDKNTVIALHSNWLGNQTKVYYIDKSIPLSSVTFENAGKL
jgi:hypothetical protein